MVTAYLMAAGVLAAQEAPDWLARVSVHGYVNQAYAVSDEHPIFGIPTSGTTDYRDLALQFRYDRNRRHALVVQFRHERLGDSPRRRDDVELDWAFYQHNAGDRVSLKAGRVPLPLGIFNEAGGAAATSPFFKPANELYDRHYTSKTLEGALASVSIGDADGWSFDVDGYGGRWKLDEWDTNDRADARDAYGAQVWANSPLPGVRIGAGAYRCEVERSTGGAPADYLMLHASVDADLDRWRLAAEYLSGNLESYGRYRAAYVQAGLEVTSRLSVHARGALARIEVPVEGHAIDGRLSDDLGLAINYSLHPNVLLKLEGHTNEGLLREDAPLNYYARPSRTRYLIASVVASF